MAAKEIIADVAIKEAVTVVAIITIFMANAMHRIMTVHTVRQLTCTE